MLIILNLPSLLCRRHRITCQNGTLKEHYMRLLARDKTLLKLSKKPFPLKSRQFENFNNVQTTLPPSGATLTLQSLL